MGGPRRISPTGTSPTAATLASSVVCVYELAYQFMVNGAIYQTYFGLNHDAIAHPNYYDAMTTLIGLCQSGGAAFATISYLCLVHRGWLPLGGLAERAAQLLATATGGMGQR